MCNYPRLMSIDSPFDIFLLFCIVLKCVNLLDFTIICYMICKSHVYKYFFSFKYMTDSETVKFVFDPRLSETKNFK